MWKGTLVMLALLKKLRKMEACEALKAKRIRRLLCVELIMGTINLVLIVMCALERV